MDFIIFSHMCIMHLDHTHHNYPPISNTLLLFPASSPSTVTLFFSFDNTLNFMKVD